MTNGDRIRSMTDDEELLSEIGIECYRCIYNNKNCCEGDCINGNLKWIQSEEVRGYNAPDQTT